MTQAVIARAHAILTDFQVVLAIIPPQQIADGANNYLISIGRIRKTP